MVFLTMRVGSLQGDVEQIEQGNATPVYKGFISSGGEHNLLVYAKPLSADDILRESICATIGRAMGIPIPEPFLIISDLPEFQSSDGIGFASLAVPHASVRLSSDSAQSCRQTLNRILSELLQWEWAAETCLFDEWMSNNDRQTGNMLYGGKGNFYMIDHASTIPLPDPAIARQNRLAEHIVNTTSENISNKIVNQVLKSLLIVRKEELLKAVRADLYHKDPGLFFDFIIERRELLPKLLQNCLDIDELQLDLTLH